MRRRFLVVAGALLALLIPFVGAPLYLMSRNPTIAVLAATTPDSYPLIPAALAAAYLTYGSYDPNSVRTQVGQPLFSFVCSAYGLAGFDRQKLLELVALLHAKGADPDVRNSGYTPLQAAILANEPDLVRELLRLGANTSLRVDSPGKPYHGFTTLEFADFLSRRKKGEREAIMQLLEARPNNAMQRSSRVVTPLATKAGRVFNATLASGAPTARRR